MRILVIGGGGQVGTKIVEQAKERFDVYATYQTRKPSLEESRIFKADKRDRDKTIEIFDEVNPEVVIDTAAIHNVDYCETHKDEAWKVNVEGTRNVADACKKQNARMIFVSTDYVFDGNKGLYTEEDSTNPISYYGVTKLEGERAVAEALNNYAIARPSVIYGYVPTDQRESSSGKPLNFAMWLVQKLQRHETLTIVNDQYSSPTMADNLAEVLLKLGTTHNSGIYHTAGGTRLNRFELSVKLAERFGLNRELIKPIATSQLKQLAKRPMDSSLSVDKIERELNLKMLKIEEALNLFYQQHITKEESKAS
jgi:dTDP-4-dehydrorhamnose reductase